VDGPPSRGCTRASPKMGIRILGALNTNSLLPASWHTGVVLITQVIYRVAIARRLLLSMMLLMIGWTALRRTNSGENCLHQWI
jgi:hypothetical protein